MRFALLASAAICLTAGAAMAQSTTASPAPTGAPDAAMSSPSGSPGNMAPNTMTAPKPVYSGQNSIAKTTSANPAPTGAPDAAQVTQPGASPGNMAPNNGGSDTAASSNASMPNSASGMAPTGASGMSKMSSNGHMHGAYRNASMPSDGDARMYLHIAADAIKQHNKMRADDALSHAETRMLDRAVPASSGAMPDDSPAVTAVEHARQALSSGDYATAASDTKMAMQAHHGMMGGSGMSPMGGSGMSPMGSSGMSPMGSSGMSPMGGSGAMGGPTQ